MANSKKTSKKMIKSKLAERMEEAFSDLSQPLGKTRFQRNIKKAVKALSQNLKEMDTAPSKKANKVKKVPVEKIKKDPRPENSLN